MSVPFIGEIDFTDLTFSPMITSNNRNKVEITKNGKKFSRVSLCKDVVFPLTLKYSLDQVGDNPDRRGLKMIVTDADCIAGLERLDEAIVTEAEKRSQEWFKKKLTRDEIKLRYRATHTPVGDGDSAIVVNKVKCGASEHPTILHLLEENGNIRKKGAKLTDLTMSAKVVPHISFTYGIWFMGGGTSFGVSFQAEEMLVAPVESAANPLSHFASSRPLKVTNDSEENEEGDWETPADPMGVGSVKLESE